MRLRNELEEELLKITGSEINGHKEKRLPNTLNIYFKGVNAEALIIKIRDEIAVSSGSACTSSDVLPSHVLVLCMKMKRAFQSIRISIGKNNLDLKNLVSYVFSEIKKLIEL